VKTETMESFFVAGFARLVKKWLRMPANAGLKTLLPFLESVKISGLPKLPKLQFCCDLENFCPLFCVT
jgi:hypothetical protein